MRVGQRCVVTTEPALAQGGDAVARVLDPGDPKTRPAKGGAVGPPPERPLDGETGPSRDGASGRVVFVRGAAPRERVEVELEQVGRRFARARVVRVLAPGPARVEPPCAHARVCGGCDLLFLDEAEAARAVFDAGRETLRRVGGLDAARLDAIPPPWTQPFAGARTRARFAVGAGRAGFREARSHRVAEITHCPALHPALERARRALAERAAELSPEGVLEVSAVTDGQAVSMAAVAPPARGSAGRPRGPKRAPARSRARPRLPSAGWPSGVHADGRRLPVRDAAGDFALDPGGFAQASRAGNDALLEHLAARLPRGARALELYAGSGNFTRLLLARFDEVHAVEGAEDAVRRGRALVPGARWWSGAAQDGLHRTPAPDLVLVDPPRAGLDAPVRSALAASPPPRLVYVSCDVGTLARDLKVLGEGGLSTRAVFAFDLYPGTHHLEWVAWLERADDQLPAGVVR